MVSLRSSDGIGRTLDNIGYYHLITGQIAGVSGYEASETCDSTDKEGGNGSNVAFGRKINHMAITESGV